MEDQHGGITTILPTHSTSGVIFATPSELMPAFIPLAHRLAPSHGLVECGGKGNCGPMALACVLYDADAVEYSHTYEHVRAAVVAHAASPTVLNRTSRLSTLTLEDAIIAAYATWGAPSLPNTVEEWAAAMGKDGTYFDHAALLLAADAYEVNIIVHLVDASGKAVPCDMIQPSCAVRPTATVTIAALADTHFMAVLPAAGVQGEHEALTNSGQCTPADPDKEEEAARATDPDNSKRRERERSPCLKKPNSALTDDDSNCASHTRAKERKTVRFEGITQELDEDTALRGGDKPRASNPDLPPFRNPNAPLQGCVFCNPPVEIPWDTSMPPWAKTSEQRRIYLSFEWPLRSLAELHRLLESAIAPTHLVAYEFSGALRSALEARGRRALSVDRRESEQTGMHACMEVQEVLHLHRWQAAFLFPNCFQQLKADEHCLPCKIADGRAFWGCLQVVWCLYAPADVVVVEQPDVILHPFLAHHLQVPHESFRTSELGDEPDKFVRLYHPHTALDLGQRRPPPANPTRLPRSQFDYANPDERDRQRSTWRHFIRTCSKVAQAEPQPGWGGMPTSFQAARERFVRWWRSQGWPTPAVYDTPNALPPTAEQRAYQQVRGPGDGRRLDPPASPSPLVEASSERGPTTPAAAPLRAGSLVPHEASGNSEWSDPGEDTSAPSWTRLHCGGVGTRAGRQAGVGTPESAARTEGITLDVRRATSATVLLCFVSVLAQPLVFAHMNGFQTVGVELPQQGTARSCALKAAQDLVSRIATPAPLAFMIGEYIEGARLCVAPLDFAPSAGEVCRSSAQRKKLLAQGRSFLWCSLAALAGTAIQDLAARALVGVEAFVKPVAALADFQGEEGVRTMFRFGSMTATSILRSPPPDAVVGPPAWVELARGRRQDAILAEALRRAGNDPLLEGWLERISPLDPSLIPPSFLRTLPGAHADYLDELPFAPPYSPPNTSWIPLPPRQPPARKGTPRCIRSVWDLMPTETRKKVKAWLAASWEDLQGIERQLEEGVEPDDVQRCRPEPIAIGQKELHWWARGIVWDCTRENAQCCEPLDFQANVSTHLNRSYLAERLSHYPDQALVSNLVLGARLDADVELQSVLIPHLQSLPHGYMSVWKELRKMKEKGWYAFFADFPYWPIYLNGNGAAPKKLSPDVWRRTTEGGGPRKEVRDAEGLRAISINDASRVPHMPEHFAADTRPEMKEWLAARGLPRPPEAPPDERGSKWPREVKPTVAQVMRDIAILRRAAQLLEEPLYVFVEDAASYFNQLVMAACERHKLGVLFLESASSAPAVSDSRGPELVFVSERVLGFGTHGASNLAQRFSEALLLLFRADMDAADAPFLRHASPKLRRWQALRLRAQERTGRPCPPGAPEKCEQLRLYAAHMYTDDPIFLVVGVERALRALRVWRTLTQRVGLIMAAPEKRSLGTHALWLGVLFVMSLGLVIVPKDKLLRASHAITDTLKGAAPFHRYRALCGLLEHLRAVNLRGKNVMHGLYRPHEEQGAGRFGPAGLVRCSDLMRKQLLRWHRLLRESAAVSVLAAVKRDEVRPPPDLHILLCADACLGDEDPAGIGGFCHGLYWNFEIPTQHLGLVTIPALELLATATNFLVFHSYLTGMTREGVELVFRTDALTTALTLPAESQRAPLMVTIFQRLLQTREFTALAPSSSVAHLFGDCNPFSDRLSRNRMEEFRKLCAQVGIRPRRVPLPASFHRLYDEMLREAALERVRVQSRSLGRCGAPRHPTVPPSVAPPLSPTETSPFLDRLRGSRRNTPENQRHSPDETADDAHRGHQLATRATSPFLSRLQSAATEANDCFREQPAVGASADGRGPTERNVNDTPYRHSPSNTSEGGTGGTFASSLVQNVNEAIAPRTTPLNEASSALFRASATYAKSQAQLLEAGEGDMALAADTSHLTTLMRTVDTLSTSGINASTRKKDERVWLLWETVCENLGTNPLRTAQDVREHPQKNAFLMAVLMLYAYARCKPKDKTRRWIRPNSAYSYPIAIKRIFRRWGVDMPGHRMTVAQLQGLKRGYLAHYGALSLAPKRAEPMKFSMVREIHAIQLDSIVNGRRWTDTNLLIFMFRRLNLVLIRTGFRLGEIVKHPSGEIMFLTFANLHWMIDRVLYTDPDGDLLRNMVPGRDCALLAPPRAKPDQFGEIHCPFPATLTLTEEADNAAAALRDIELRCRVRGSGRERTALFCNEAGAPFTHAAFDGVLRDALTHLYGPRVAGLYSFHSYRSGLATALHAAGVPDPMIMLICRWMCQESLHVYRRMGTRENEAHVRAASHANVDVIQSVNVPDVSGDHHYARLFANFADTNAGEHAQAMEADTSSPEQSTAQQPSTRQRNHEGTRTRRANSEASRAGSSTSSHPTSTLPPKGTNIEVYWTDMQTWYHGCITSHRKDRDGTTIVSRVKYTPTGAWQRPKDLIYWHNLRDTQWRLTSNALLTTGPASPAPSPPHSDTEDAFSTPPPSPTHLRCRKCTRRASTHNTPCVRCNAVYCSAACAWGDILLGHLALCPLPKFTSTSDNAVVVEGDHRYLARCVTVDPERENVTVWFMVPHRQSCPLCTRNDAYNGWHYTWTRVPATQVAHATPQDMSRGLRPRATGGRIYTSFPSDKSSMPPQDPFSLI